MTFKIGDHVKMVNCCEAEEYSDKIWIVKSEPWKLGCGVEVVILEGWSGGFGCDFLQKVTA